MRPRTAAPAVASLLLLGACRGGSPPHPPVLADLPSPAPQAGPPADPSERFVEAWRRCRKGDAEGALRLLGQLEEVGWDIPPDAADFPALASRAEFAGLVARIASRVPRTAFSEVATTLPEEGLIAEGIAADPRDGSLYVGSIALRKVVLVEPSGASRDFVAPGARGLGEVLGLEVDVSRGLLWAASNARAGDGPRSTLHAFDLATGEERRSSTLTGPGHLLNDVVVAADGTAFATDSQAGRVYRLPAGAAQLVELPPSFHEPNGIALVEGSLVVADSHGLWALQGDAAPRPLVAPGSSPLGGIDGLSARGRTLVAIQNAFGAARVLKIELSAGATAVRSVEVLEAGNPLWHIPTTGDLLGDDFVYIGNSHVDAHRDDTVAPGGRVATRIHRLRVSR